MILTKDLANLSKSEVIDLLDINQSEIVIKYCIPKLIQLDKCKYIQFLLTDICTQFKDDTRFKKVSKLIIDQICKGKNNKSQIKAYDQIYIKLINQYMTQIPGGEGDISDEHFKSIVVNVQRANGIQCLLELLDENIDQAIEESIEYFVDTTCLNLLDEENAYYIDIMRSRKRKEYTLYLMFLTGIWPNE